MDPDLQLALQNPSVSLLAGKRPAEQRASLKKANGLRKFGAAVMLGAALLSPVQSVMANTAHLQEQATEQTQGPSQDVFAMEVAGRRWDNAGGESGRPYDTQAWVTQGELVYTDVSRQEQDIPRQTLEAQALKDYAQQMVKQLDIDHQTQQGKRAMADLVAAARVDLSRPATGMLRGNMEETILLAHGRAEAQRQGIDQLSQEGQAVYRQAVESAMSTLGYAQPWGWEEAAPAATPAPSAATVEQKEAYSSWRPKRDEYEVRAAWQTKDPMNATGREAYSWNMFSELLMGDAYAEISKGHSLENPSARLMDVCRQIQKVDQQSPGFNTHAHKDIVFETCEAEGMAFAVKIDNLKEYSVAGVAILGAVVLKGLAVTAQLAGGAMLLDNWAGTSLMDRRKRRDGTGAVSGPGNDDTSKPNAPTIG